MATMSITLGEHWEAFIRSEVSSGRYGTASEVIRDALRGLEEKKSKLDALKAHLAVGAAQSENGEYINQPLEDMLSGFKTDS